MAVIFVQVSCVLVLALTAALVGYVIFGRHPRIQTEDRAADVWKHKHPPTVSASITRSERVTAGDLACKASD
jgi:hypothetical protein